MTDWIRKGTGEEIKERESNGVTYLYFPALEETGLVRHAFSTRMGGVSKGCFSSMNFSFSRGDDPDDVRENYRRMASAIGVEYDSFVVSEQEHTTNLLTVTEELKGSGVLFERPYRAIDGLLTCTKGITLVTFYADCIPLYFLDPVKEAIALSHSGWKGTLSEMGRITAERMKHEFGSRPEDLIVCIGPGICRDCYEIGEEVAEKFRKGFTAGNADEILSGYHDGHWQLDLWHANELVLLKAGVLPQHIHISDICTRCNSDRLYSHRASGERRGNLAAFLELKLS